MMRRSGMGPEKVLGDVLDLVDCASPVSIGWNLCSPSAWAKMSSQKETSKSKGHSADHRAIHKHHGRVADPWPRW